MRRIALVSLGLLPAAVAACGGGGGGTPAKSGVAGASVRAVTVRESEYKLQLSTTKLGAGTYRFTARNVGTIPHALEIDGPGVSDMRTPGTIAPGSSKTLTVTLKQGGSYEIYCPVPGHKAMGMDLHVKVGGGAAATSSSKSSGGGWG
jgi:uncharacterized cupredoxin-like copper-binding protein